MKRIRIGNDFVYLWSIERGGEPENLDAALEKKLLIKVFKTPKSIPFTTTGNVIRVELTPDICSIVGTYNLEFSYKLPDMSLSDDERTCTVDIDAFQIVGKSAQADEVEEITSTSDVAIGLNGKDAFEVWLEDNPGGTKEDYYNWLQKPAIDIAETVGLQEQARVEAENTRENNEEQRVEAELLRQSNTQEAISNAENATENANNAKGWTPSVAFEEYNGKQIKKLIGYIGGTGAEPTANIGQYYTENGFTNNKELAVNFKGSSVEAMIQTRDSYNQLPEPRNPNTLYFISNQA